MSHPNNDRYLEYERENFEEAEYAGDTYRMEEIIARLKSNGFDTSSLEQRLAIENDFI